MRSRIPAKCRVRIAQQHHEVHQCRQRTPAEVSHGKGSILLRQLLILAAGIAMKMTRDHRYRMLQPKIANAGPGLRNWHSLQTLSLACLVVQEVLSLSPARHRRHPKTVGNCDYIGSSLTKEPRICFIRLQQSFQMSKPLPATDDNLFQFGIAKLASAV